MSSVTYHGNNQTGANWTLTVDIQPEDDKPARFPLHTAPIELTHSSNPSDYPLARLENVHFSSEPHGLRRVEFGTPGDRWHNPYSTISQNISAYSYAGGVAVHLFTAAILIAALGTTDLTGGGGQDLQAVEVSFVDTTALQAKTASNTDPGQHEFEADPLQDGGGEQNTTEVASNTPIEKIPKNEEQASPLMTIPVMKASPLSSPNFPAQPETPPPPPELREENPTSNEPQEWPSKSEKRPEKSAGVQTRANETPTQLSQAKRAATQGQISHFNASLWKAIQAQLPRRHRIKGTVTVEFSIDNSGNIIRTHIIKSSGSPLLDGIAINAVRRAEFNSPPKGMTESQLSYKIPIRFK